MCVYIYIFTGVPISMVHVYMPGTARRTGCLRCRCPSIETWSATPSTGGRGMFVHSGTVLWQEKAKFHTESTWNLIDFLSRWLFYMLNLTQPGTAWYPLTMEPGFARHWRTNWTIAPRGTLPKFWGHLWLWNDNQDVGWGVFGKPSPICVNVQAVGSCSLLCRWWSLNFEHIHPWQGKFPIGQTLWTTNFSTALKPTLLGAAGSFGGCLGNKPGLRSGPHLPVVGDSFIINSSFFRFFIHSFVRSFVRSSVCPFVHALLILTVPSTSPSSNVRFVDILYSKNNPEACSDSSHVDSLRFGFTEFSPSRQWFSGSAGSWYVE